ncbi:MAG: acyl carrier protein [Planctomycetota bacterium]
MRQARVEDIQSSLVEIVRRDLKLDGVEITPQTSLAAEDLGLDSLDYLMLITSIEKHYGVKLTADEMGPDTMRDLATLAAYLQTKMA